MFVYSLQFETNLGYLQCVRTSDLYFIYVAASRESPTKEGEEEPWEKEVDDLVQWTSKLDGDQLWCPNKNKSVTSRPILRFHRIATRSVNKNYSP